MDGVRVKDHPELYRSNRTRGLILNSNSDAYNATVAARNHVRGLEERVDALTKLVQQMSGEVNK